MTTGSHGCVTGEPPVPANANEHLSDKCDLTRKRLVHRFDRRNEHARSADRTGAELARVDLIGAALSYVDFTDADRSDAALTGAYLYRAKFNGTCLGRTDLAEAVLIRADFAGAQLGADLRDADLTGAQFFAQADFGDQARSHVKLTDAKLNLTGTKWPTNREIPHGWELNVGTGRLERAGTDSGSVQANIVGSCHF